MKYRNIEEIKRSDIACHIYHQFTKTKILLSITPRSAKPRSMIINCSLVNICIIYLTIFTIHRYINDEMNRGEASLNHNILTDNPCSFDEDKHIDNGEQDMYSMYSRNRSIFVTYL